MRISHRQGIHANGFVSKPITATLNSVNLIKGTNRSDVTAVDKSSEQWVGKFNTYQSLELVMTIDKPCSEINLSIDYKYFTVQVLDVYYWYCCASSSRLSAFPANVAGGQPFRFRSTDVSKQRLTVTLYGNFAKGTLYVYFGTYARKADDFNRAYIYADSISISAMSTRKPVDVKFIETLSVYRYSSDDASSYWWKTVAEHGGTHSVYGRNRLDGINYHATCIPIPAFSVGGKYLIIRFYGYFPETHTFRWQLCTSMANKALYQLTDSAVADSYAIDSGTFHEDGIIYGERKIELAASVPANTPLYLYFWAYEDGNAAPHIQSDWGVTAIVTSDLTAPTLLTAPVMLGQGDQNNVGESDELL